MNIGKLETRQPWLCEVDGTTYVRTEIQWNDDRPNIRSEIKTNY
jgi:hypothetical protein